MLVAVGEADLVALSIGEGAVTETGHITLDSEIACLHISPLGAPLVCDRAGSQSQQLAAEADLLLALLSLAHEQLFRCSAVRRCCVRGALRSGSRAAPSRLAAGEDADAGGIAAVGTWAMSLHTYRSTSCPAYHLLPCLPPLTTWSADRHCTLVHCC